MSEKKTIFMHFFGKESGKVEISEFQCIVNDHYVYINDKVLLKSPQSNSLAPGIGDLIYKPSNDSFEMYLFERNPMRYIKAFIEMQKSIVADFERNYLDAKHILEQIEKCVEEQVFSTISQAKDFKRLLEAGIPDRELIALEYSVWAYENTNSVKVVDDMLHTEDERIFLDACRWWDGCMETEDFIESVFHFYDIRPVEVINQLEGKELTCSHCNNTFTFSDDAGCGIHKHKPMCAECFEKATAICQRCFTRVDAEELDGESCLCKKCQEKAGA